MLMLLVLGNCVILQAGYTISGWLDKRGGQDGTKV
jgi:hypothetical protein